MGVVLALEAIFLVWHLRHYGIPNVRALFSTVYLSIIFVTALYTLIVSDREPLQKLKQMERDMEAGITPERLPTSPQWRRRQLLAGILQAIFFATILLAPFFSAFFS